MKRAAADQPELFASRMFSDTIQGDEPCENRCHPPLQPEDRQNPNLPGKADALGTIARVEILKSTKKQARFPDNCFLCIYFKGLWAIVTLT